MGVQLEVTRGPEKGKVFVADQATTYVGGRDPRATIHFSEADPCISRNHFLLEVCPSRAYFRDVDAKNPSRVNDMVIAEVELHDGDVIEVGYTLLKVHLNLEVRTESVRCRQCGAPLEICAGEERLQYCQRCYLQHSGARYESYKTPFNPQCFVCGRDLSPQANADGMATSLGNKAVYCCQVCLPPGDTYAGQVLGGYRVVKMLGEGGMGRVFLAHHEPTSRVVAIKQMHIEDKKAAARFEREIRIMRVVDHPNVLAYIGQGLNEEKKRPYLVMEYASGGSLVELMEDGGGRLPVEGACRYMVQVLDGLQYIHGKGIVHRDLKPENILLRPLAAAGLVPKIADFGLSREYSIAGGPVLTSMGVAMGTILYMPPEQVRDSHSVTEKADIYSAGATFYHLLTGKYPFDFPTPADVIRFMIEHRIRPGAQADALRQIMNQHNLKEPYQIVLEDQPIPVRERNPDLPEKLADLLDKALRKEPNQRHASAREFKRQLQDFLGESTA